MADVKTLEDRGVTLSIRELARRLKKRKEAVESGDPTGGDAFYRGENANEVREALGVKTRRKP